MTNRLLDDINATGVSNVKSRKTMLQQVNEANPQVLDSLISGQDPRTLSGFAKNILPSAGRAVSDIFSVVGHPIKTLGGLFSVGRGGLSSAVGQGQDFEADVAGFDAVKDFFVERYGTVEAAQKTAYEDPIGFALDVTSVLGGGGSLVRTAGRVSKLPAVARTGSLISETASTIDPLAATTRAVGRGLEIIGGKIKIAPFASKVDKGVQEAAQRQGIELPASAQSRSRVVPVIESVEGKSLFGGRIPEMLDSANLRLNKIADDLVTQTGESGDLVITGQKIEKGANDFRTAWFEEKNKLYQAAEKQLKAQPLVIRPEQSLRLLRAVIAEKTLARAATPAVSDLKFFKEQLKLLENPTKKVRQADGTIKEVPTTLSVNQMRAAIKELNNRINSFSADPVITGNRGLWKKLVTTMSEDLDTVIARNNPELGDALEKANQFYQDGLNRLNSSYGDKITSLAQQPDKILPAILNPQTSIEDIPRIFVLAGEDSTNAIRASTLKQIFDKAKNADGQFTPQGLTREMNKLGDGKIQAILTPEQFSALSDLREITNSLGKVEKVLSGSQTAFIGRLIASLGGIFVNPMMALKFIIGDQVFSTFISSKAGQKFLLEGTQFTGQTGRNIQSSTEALRGIGRGAFQMGRLEDEL